MVHSDKAWEEGQVLRCALAHPDCRITEAPSWVILTLLEGITRRGCRLLEHLVMTLDDSQGIVIAESHLDGAVQTLIMNVLLATLYEDGYVEFLSGLLNEPQFFEFQHPLDVQITLTPSGEQAHIWEALALQLSYRLGHPSIQ